MTASVEPTRFDEMYRDDRTTHGLPAATPWDIGGPQPVVKQLVSLGAVKGEVAFEQMVARNPDLAENMQPMLERFRIIEPLLVNGRAHTPFWEVHATRVD
jgi:hypothetical protein